MGAEGVAIEVPGNDRPSSWVGQQVIERGQGRARTRPVVRSLVRSPVIRMWSAFNSCTRAHQSRGLRSEPESSRPSQKKGCRSEETLTQGAEAG